MEDSDEEVVLQVIAGDTNAFGVLIERYESRLRRYAKKFLLFDEDATDMVQEVFVKAYTNLQSFDPTQRFSPWLYRIAHNTYINELRRREKAPVHFFDPDTLFPYLAADEETDREALARELHTQLEEQLGKLEAKYREPIVLYYFEHMSYDDIAEVLRIPKSTVGVRINRAKAKLRTFLAAADIQAP